MSDCPVYVINLDRSPKRLAKISAQLAEFGFAWKRISAVDGAALGPLPWTGYDERAYRRKNGKRPNANELGCYLSHVAAMQQLLADGGEAALILEDDARLGPALSDVIRQLLACRDEWDVVKLGGYHRGLPVTTRQLGSHRLVAFLAPHTGSYAYLVSRNAAEKYLAYLLPMRVPYDHEFDCAWRYGIRFRGVLPHPVRAGKGPTDIGSRHMPGVKFVWYRRGGTLIHRVAKQTRRVAHYLLSDTAWMRNRG